MGKFKRDLHHWQGRSGKFIKLAKVKLGNGQKNRVKQSFVGLQQFLLQRKIAYKPFSPFTL